MLKSLALTLGFVAVLGAPALAMNSITNVPSLWPTDGAFDKETVSQSISDQVAEIPAQLPHPRDR